MNTLAKQLEEIKKSNASLSEKKEMCIKLGMRPRDIEILEFTGFFNDKCLTFGVEIECDVRRMNVERMATPGFNFYYEGYNHRDHRDYFKFVSDGSLSGASPIECVTPILDDNADGFNALKTCCKVLNDAGASVNRTCGLHVHVGIADYAGEEIVNIYKNYQRLESLIDSFMAPSRRGDGCRWAKSIAIYDYDSCHSQSDVKYRMHQDRYHKVNPMAYDRHGTIEFRQHQGSVDYKKISMWVNFCCKLVEWSKKHVLEHYVFNIDDVPFINEQEKRFFAGRIREFATA